MDKTLQDLAWSVLPKEFKEEVRRIGNILNKDASVMFGTIGQLSHKHLDLFVKLFGIDNLTSDAKEEDEMLTVSRKKVQEEYAVISKELSHRDTDAEDYIAWNYVKMTFEEFYGSKCLPDACNVASTETKPAKPKFKVGDRVITPERGKNMPLTIRCKTGKHYYAFEEIDYDIHEDYLEPYTEQEENVNLSQETSNSDKYFDTILKKGFSKERRLNIAAMAMQGLLANPNNNASLSETIADALNCADALLHEVEKGGSK